MFGAVVVAADGADGGDAAAAVVVVVPQSVCVLCTFVWAGRRVFCSLECFVRPLFCVSSLCWAAAAELAPPPMCHSHLRSTHFRDSRISAIDRASTSDPDSLLAVVADLPSEIP